MSEWTKLNIKKENLETAYSEVVARSKRLTNGLHTNVRIVSVSPIPGHAGVIVDWQNDEGQGITQYIFSGYNDRDTDDVKIAPLYIHFARALSGTDFEIYQKFFLTAYQECPEVLNNVKGLYANIRVGMPKKGVTIRKNGEQYQLVQIETGEVLTHLQEESGGLFATYTEARDTAKENGIRVQYNCVLATFPSSEKMGENRKQLRDAYEEYCNSAATPISKPKAVQGF